MSPYATRTDHDCHLYVSGLESFNRGHYFECHERLEDLWLRADGEVRPFYQGLIQLAAAFVHLERGSERPAASLLRQAGDRLAPFGPAMLGLDVASLLLDLEAWRAHTGQEGSERLSALAPTLRYTAPSLAAFEPHAGRAPGPRLKRAWYWDREQGT